MGAVKDYYKILGVNKDFTESELKSNYRKLALKYHPDKNPNDKAAEDRFKDAAEAYSVLSDPEKRRKYDNPGVKFRFRGFGSGSTGQSPSMDEIRQMYDNILKGMNRRTPNFMKRKKKKNSNQAGLFGALKKGLHSVVEEVGSKIDTDDLKKKCKAGVETVNSKVREYQRQKVDKNYGASDNMLIKIILNDNNFLLGLDDLQSETIKAEGEGAVSYRKNKALTIKAFDGKVTLPFDIDFKLYVEVSGGKIGGDIAHRGTMRASGASEVNLNFSGSLGIDLDTDGGFVAIRGMKYAGDNFYVPKPISNPVRKLELSLNNCKAIYRYS